MIEVRIHPDLPSKVEDEVTRTVLREAITRYNNELLDDEERLLLQDRIRRLRKRLGL